MGRANEYILPSFYENIDKEKEMTISHEQSIDKQPTPKAILIE